MKKIAFIFVLLSLIAMPCVAQDPPKQEELASTQVIDKIFDRTTEAVQELAQALKIPAEHVYSVLVKQQKINSLCLLIVPIIVIIIGCSLIYFSYKDWKNVNIAYHIKNNTSSSYNDKDLDDGYWIWSITFGAVMSVVALMVVLIASGTILTGLINPEYGAIKDIIGAF